MDGPLFRHRMVNFLKRRTQNAIPGNLRDTSAGGTDALLLQRYGKRGAIAGAYSPSPAPHPPDHRATTSATLHPQLHRTATAAPAAPRPT